VLSGWASLNDRNCPDATALVEQNVELRTLDSLNLQDVGFVKIDVEGHELDVLRGGAETIQRNRPHLLIEVRENHLTEIRDLLLAWGYREVPLESLCGVPGSAQNYIFVPATDGPGRSVSAPHSAKASAAK
jgi:hypothetical protein